MVPWNSEFVREFRGGGPWESFFKKRILPLFLMLSHLVFERARMASIGNSLSRRASTYCKQTVSLWMVTPMLLEGSRTWRGSQKNKMKHEYGMFYSSSTRDDEYVVVSMCRVATLQVAFMLLLFLLVEKWHFDLGFFVGAADAAEEENDINHPDDNDNDLCTVYIAESTILGAGLGIFTAIDRPEGSMIGKGDVMIPLIDLLYHFRAMILTNNNNSCHNFDQMAEQLNPFLDYVWNGPMLGMQRETAHPFTPEYYVSGA